jgi:hypothetical protein
MPNTFAEALRRHEEAKRKQYGGGEASNRIIGPKCSGAPPGPNGQYGGSSFPNYGPEIKNKSSPPGPTAS